jgi:hypothetical protein
MDAWSGVFGLAWGKTPRCLGVREQTTEIRRSRKRFVKPQMNTDKHGSD